VKIPISAPCLGDEELEAVVAAVKSGWVSSQGAFIKDFEQGFADYCGVKYGVATCNGTVALHLALAALGIGPGDEVLVPALTFVATANAVTYTGAKPVFVDSQPDYWGIDPDSLEVAITPRSKAVIPVHLYGHPCDMDAIMEIAHRHGLYVIEDAAEAHGAIYKGRKVGSLGQISCFSFYGNKIITTGEGGMCMTNDTRLIERMRILRDHGMNPQRRYWHDIVGFNYRMTNLQGALGVAQLKRLASLVAKKRTIAEHYLTALDPLIKDRRLSLQASADWAASVYWLFPIVARTEADKSRIVSALSQAAIETRPLFVPIHTLPPYRTTRAYPVAERLAARGLCLPSHPNLTREDIRLIADVITSAL